MQQTRGMLAIVDGHYRLATGAYRSPKGKCLGIAKAQSLCSSWSSNCRPVPNKHLYLEYLPLRQTRISAVAKRLCNCCVGQFWPKHSGRGYSALTLKSVYNLCHIIGLHQSYRIEMLGIGPGIKTKRHQHIIRPTDITPKHAAKLRHSYDFLSQDTERTSNPGGRRASPERLKLYITPRGPQRPIS